MQLASIDFDPWAKLGPSIAHDLELQANGLQLLRRRVTNFYCEFFHISFIVSAGPELPPRTGEYFHKFIAPGKY